jgi:hypothetical protein
LRVAELLEAATASLRACRPWLEVERNEPASDAAAVRVSAGVRLIRRLPPKAREYYSQWDHILGAMSAGYTPDGRRRQRRGRAGSAARDECRMMMPPNLIASLLHPHQISARLRFRRERQRNNQIQSNLDLAKADAQSRR